ncbi:YeeE/YedE thiosulfate transporter family protein [Clostridium malenominatum]|uniref:YeeE/YedE thiosulfate transporter family protein n=1 Tax=Clostridium malenominatum TaxID=1539 RepID=A0ABN1IQD2_9CLOT
MKWFNKIFKNPWPYWIGGTLLAFLNIILLWTAGQAWRVTSGFLYWGCHILELCGFNPSSWYYFQLHKRSSVYKYDTFFNNEYTFINLGIILGALIASLIASQFSIKKIKNKKQFVFALVGGIIMGYGTRLAFGCNIGALFSAIPSLSLHGWIFGVFMFLGAGVGSIILIKYIL